MKSINTDLIAYVESDIIPRYDSFDKAHNRQHVLTVISESLELAKNIDGIDLNMVYAIAAYHDTGLCRDRKTHHIVSGEIIQTDTTLRRWFSEEEIAIMKEAAEDHRASGASEPRSMYGKIVAEADRVIDQDTIIRRTIQFGHKHYPDLSPEEHIARAVSHLKEKYGRGGYLKLWIPWSDNAARLNALQDLIADDEAVQEAVRRAYMQLQ
jgi:uncharacterized protein